VQVRANLDSRRVGSCVRVSGKSRDPQGRASFVAAKLPFRGVRRQAAAFHDDRSAPKDDLRALRDLSLGNARQ